MLTVHASTSFRRQTRSSIARRIRGYVRANANAVQIGTSESSYVDLMDAIRDFENEGPRTSLWLATCSRCSSGWGRRPDGVPGIETAQRQDQAQTAEKKPNSERAASRAPIAGALDDIAAYSAASPPPVTACSTAENTESSFSSCRGRAPAAAYPK